MLLVAAFVRTVCACGSAFLALILPYVRPESVTANVTNCQTSLIFPTLRYPRTSQNQYKRGTQAKGFLGLLLVLLQIGSLQQPIEGGAQVLMLLLQPG